MAKWLWWSCLNYSSASSLVWGFMLMSGIYNLPAQPAAYLALCSSCHSASSRLDLEGFVKYFTEIKYTHGELSQKPTDLCEWFTEAVWWAQETKHSTSSQPGAD